MVSFVPNHVTPGHRGANTNHAPSVFAFDPQELILLCELGRNPSDLFRTPASESALRICLHDFSFPSNWWTWHDLNVRPRPSQSRALIPLSYRSGISGGERAALTATSAVARSHRNFGG